MTGYVKYINAPSVRQPTEVEVFTPNPARKPNLERVNSVVLKPGPAVKRTATLYKIRDPKTGGHHHDSLAIETFVRCDGAWNGPDEKRCLTLGEGEVEPLTDLLLANRIGTSANNGKFLLVDAESDAAQVFRLLQGLDTSEKADALAMVLRQTADRPALIKKLVERLAKDDGYLAKTVAAMNLEVCRRVVAELEEMIDDPARTEQDFQNLLERNPWVFGSEYSCLLERRRWTRDEVFDFVPRRTTDDRIELIEIKTPLEGRALFALDPSHKTLYPTAVLSKVTAQAQNYLEKLDRDRDKILANDHVDVTKACLKIIIGRDGNESQRAALHRHTSHLIRIDIVTFDGLLRIAKRVLSYLEEPVCDAQDLDDNIPF